MNEDLKFTDSNLKLFYAQLLEHYKECLKNNPNADVGTIYTEMYTAVQYALYSPHGHLKSLAQDEKQKVFTAFEFLFQSLPLPEEARKKAALVRPVFNVNTIKVVHEYHYYSRPRYNWIYLNTMTHDCSYRNHSHSSAPAGGASSSSHGHSSNTSSSDTDYAKLLAMIALILLASVAAVLVVLALYHMFSEFMDSVERFWYGEGWLRAALLLASSLVFTATAFLLSVTFAALPFAALAVAAGLDPFLVAGIAVSCLTVMGSGLGSFVMGLLHDSIDKSYNQESMDPSDPYRFRLTAEDELRLQAKGIDPIRVKCAMVALRAEIAKELKSEDKVPSYLSRGFFGSSQAQAVQPLLDKVRAIRYGELNSVKVGDLNFDFTVPLYSHNNASTQYVPLNASLFAAPATNYVLSQQHLAPLQAIPPLPKNDIGPLSSISTLPQGYVDLLKTIPTMPQYQPVDLEPAASDVNTSAEGQPPTPAYNPGHFASLPNDREYPPPPAYAAGSGSSFSC